MAPTAFVLASAEAYPEHSYTQAEVLEAIAGKNNFSAGMPRFARTEVPERLRLTEARRSGRKCTAHLMLRHVA